MVNDIFTARKRSLGQGNIFTPVCHSVHRGGVRGRGVCVARGHACPRGACMPGVCVWPGGHAWLGACMVGGRHARGGGMHARGDVHATHAPRPDTMRYGRSLSGQYASYWNALSLQNKFTKHKRIQ